MDQVAAEFIEPRGNSLRASTDFASLCLHGCPGRRRRAFDEAIALFSLTYADQNEIDHAAPARAVKEGRVMANAISLSQGCLRVEAIWVFWRVN